MGLSDPGAELAAVMGSRPFRWYPALLSTEAAALDWARSGAEHGSVVSAGYQASPRGRNGFPWEIPTEGGGCSVVLRPAIPAHRVGYLYTLATLALASTIGGGIRWPDTLLAGEDLMGAVAVNWDGDLFRIDWAVVSLMSTRTGGVGWVGQVVDALEQELAAEPGPVVEEHRRRLACLGRPVRARLLPLGPNARLVEGVAVDTEADGGLVVETGEGARRKLLPEQVGTLDPG